LAVALKLLLIVSIVLQSITAVASATSQSHQIDIEHLQTQHDHSDDLSNNAEEIGEDDHDIKDCHHCGHCSGSHLSWILISNSNSATKLYNNNLIPYQFDQTKEFLDAILRPPIS
jgi:hypothetical protein